MSAVPTSEDLRVALAVAKRELALERRKEEIRRENGILCYNPHPKQLRFHAAAWFHYRYARTGNRFGKSEMGAAEDVAFALGYRPWIPEGVTIRTLGLCDEFPSESWDLPLRTLGIPRHATKGLIVTTDWDKSTEIFTSEEPGANLGKLFKYIPKAALGGYTRNHSGAIDTIRVKHISGDWSVIHLDTVKSFKQNKLGQESSSWDWAHFDEPIPIEMYNAIIRGFVDRDGRCWFTCTPLSEPWIDEKFNPDLESQTAADMATFDHGDFWMMTGSTWDNPHNRREAIDRVMSQYTDEERDTRLSGTPRAYAGLVYKEFDWNCHVLRTGAPPGWKSWDEPPKDACIRFAIDYHFRKNDAVLFLATMPSGITYVYAEIWEQLLLEDEVLRIKSVLGPHTPQPGLVDPLASTPNKMTDVTAMDEYRRLGLPVLPATKDPVNGIRAVKANLKARTKDGRPVLVFNPALRRTLFEIARGFVWDDDENKPVKKNDDMMENLYRICLQGLEYIEPADMFDYSPLHRDPDDMFHNIIDAADFLRDPDARPARSFNPAVRYAR